MSIVSLQQCNSYDLELVKEKLTRLFDHLGGLSSFIKPNQRVFIKVNALGPFDPSLGITTHPILLQALIQLIKQVTNNITVGDNPATKDISYTLRKNGVMAVLEQENVPLFSGKELMEIENNEAFVYKRFAVSSEMMDTDVFINVPKLKTHALTYMTVAQKNLFGLIYGLEKASWHVKANNPYDFAKALSDLYGAFLSHMKDKTVLHLCDGILGLEGDGPSTAGKPVWANALLLSTDAIALDRVALEIAKLNPDKFIHNELSASRGYGTNLLSQIKIVGDDVSIFNQPPFLSPMNPLSIKGVRILRYQFLKNLLFEKPLFDASRCIRCKECVKICPPKALSIKPGQIPKLDAFKCIRCWCCAEVCPKDAISKSTRPILGRILIKNR